MWVASPTIRSLPSASHAGVEAQRHPDSPSLLPFYLGGFLGPFGTLIIIPMFPELRSVFDASTEAVSWALPAYMWPMAALLLVSGTIGERLGRRRVLTVTLVLYAIASIGTAAAPTLGWFLAGRAAQGACNAFFTPLLLAGLADVCPPHQLSSKLGVFAAFQAAGAASAPFAGGLSAEFSWRLAFLATAAVTMALVVVDPLASRAPTRPPGTANHGDEAGPPAAIGGLRSLLTTRMALLGAASFFFAMGPYVGAVLVGLKARDQLGLSAGAAGLVIPVGNACGALVGRYWGRALDRWGTRVLPSLYALGSGLGLATVALPTHWATLALAWALAGATAVAVIVCLQTFGATAVPSNRGGALSASMAFRFLGHGLGPVIWVPVFGVQPRLAFIGAGSIAIVGAIAFAFLGTPRLRPTASA